MSEALRFRSVEFGYREASVLVDLDLAIDTGEMVAVLGPNGTGKTTLVRLASGQLAPRAGSIRLAGRELREQTAVERARAVAVVPQETHLAFNYTVEEVVMMGRAPHQGMLGITRTVDRETVVLAMERTGVTHLARRGFARLSGGERQRVVIARALAQEPRVLLLDEPTSFLDLRHRLIVYALLERLSREVGLTLVVVSHDINLVARHCPRLVLLHRGRVHADGTPEAVLTPARLREVYGVEAEVRPDPVNGRPYVVGLRAP